MNKLQQHKNIFQKQQGYSVIESLLALIIMSGVWSNIVNLLQQQATINFKQKTEIRNLFNKQHNYENASANCFTSNCNSLKPYADFLNTQVTK